MHNRNIREEGVKMSDLFSIFPSEILLTLGLSSLAGRKDITVEDIAKMLGLNRSYFGKIFKEALGKSPQEFLLSFGMAKTADWRQAVRR